MISVSKYRLNQRKKSNLLIVSMKSFNLNAYLLIIYYNNDYL